MSANPIPKGFEGATPHLCCKDAAAAIEFYKAAFGATEHFRLPMGPRVGHAEIQIAGARIMLADEFPDYFFQSPGTIGGTPVSLLIYVPDVDALAERAIAAGAEVLAPVADQFYGDRTCKLKDPEGHVWSFATHIEDVSPEEANKRFAALCGDTDDAS